MSDTVTTNSSPPMEPPKDEASVKQYVIALVQLYQESLGVKPTSLSGKSKASRSDSSNAGPPIGPGVFLQVAPFGMIDYLEVKELVQCRATCRELRTLLFPKVEEYVVTYFLPTTDMVRGADAMIEKGKWPRCVTLLAELAHRINVRCRRANLRPPLLYRVFLARELLRFLDKTCEPILRNFFVSGDVGAQEWNYVQGNLLDWELDYCECDEVDYCECDKYDEADCPPLLPCFKGMNSFAVLPNYTHTILEDSPQTLKTLDQHGLSLCHVHDYDDFVLLSKADYNGTPSIGAVCYYGGCYSPDDEFRSNHEDYNVLQLFLSLLTNEDNSASNFSENAYLEMKPRELVVWYTLLQSLQIHPFAGGADAQTLWNIVSTDNTKWNSTFQYYRGLELYQPRIKEKQG